MHMVQSEKETRSKVVLKNIAKCEQRTAHQV